MVTLIAILVSVIWKVVEVWKGGGEFWSEIWNLDLKVNFYEYKVSRSVLWNQNFDFYTSVTTFWARKFIKKKITFFASKKNVLQIFFLCMRRPEEQGGGRIEVSKLIRLPVEKKTTWLLIVKTKKNKNFIRLFVAFWTLKLDGVRYNALLYGVHLFWLD